MTSKRERERRRIEYTRARETLRDKPLRVSPERLSAKTRRVLKEIETERSAAQLAATRRGMGPRKK